jgi:ribose transport system permease protein
MVIILGGIDLSVGAIIAFAGVFAVGMIQWFNVPIPIGIISGILIGLVFGLFNGFVVAKTTIPPFIVTLATMNIARGAAYVFTGGQPVTCMSNSFISFGSGYLFGIPLPVIYFIIIVIISSIILNNTKMGRYILATGGNLEAAEYSGIKIGKVKLFTYAFSGLLAGFAGVVLASRMYSGQPTAGNGAELDAIAAVVLGGTSMMGGSGTIGGTIIGALVIGVLNNGQDLMNINSFWQYIVKGVVILLAVYVDFIKQKKSSFA